MKTNSKGIELIKSFESCKLKAYKLKGDKYYTIGWGHSFDESIKEDTVWTQEQCDAQLEKDLSRFEDYVTNIAMKKFDNLNSNQFSALVSYTYNRGKRGLNQLVNNSDSISEMSENIVVYWGSAEKYKNGLVRRRKAEKELFDEEDKTITATVNVKSVLNMRDDSGAVITTIPTKTKVEVLSTEDKTMTIKNVRYVMTKIKYKSETGYVAKKYLKF